jgi:hypothetical protein
MSRNWLPPRAAAACALAAAAVVLAGASAADPVAPGDVKAFDKLIVDTLRDVHNKGADLYNEKRDYDGAYRLYQGSLLTVRPLLGHHPTAQKAIDDGLAAADKEPDITRKGFILHETIERVRADLRGLAPPKADDKKGTTPPVKMDDKKGTEPPLPPGKLEQAKVSGRVLYLGKSVSAGEIAFVPVDPKAGKTTTVSIKDGTYTAAVAPGEYAVALTGGKDAKLPAKYATSDTSGIKVTVKDGVNSFDIELK